MCSRGSVNLSVTGRPLSAAEVADARGTGKIPPLSTDESTTGVIEADSTATVTWFEIRVSVRDTGVGISAENIKKLFQSVSHATAPLAVTIMRMRWVLRSGGKSDISVFLCSFLLFCQFSQVHRASSVSGGTGLGQAI